MHAECLPDSSDGITDYHLTRCARTAPVFGNIHDLLPATEVARRWDEMLDAEARIIAAQPPAPTMHSGVRG